MYNFIIGAGHTPYGAGCGAGGARGQLNESDCTRQVAPLVAQKLNDIGKSAKYIVFDRPNQTYLEDCYWRANEANRLGCEMYVEIHFNAGGGTGSEVLVSPKSTSTLARSVAARVSENIAKTMMFRDRGVKEESLIVLNKTSMPSILVECCFVDNSIDFDKYNPNKIADAIVSGLIGETVINNTRVKGWNKNDTGWWYCTDVANGYYYKDTWNYIDYKWYSFDGDGYARHDCWLQDCGKWYYFKANCDMYQNEWLYYNNNWYYLGKDGAMIENDWVLSNSKWYYLNKDGIMLKDCVFDGHTFGPNGAMI